jgi:hypothetical protein
VKTGAYSVLYAVISCSAIAFCFVPFLLLAFKQMRKVNTYCIIGIYWLLNGVVNFQTLNASRASEAYGFLSKLGSFYNYVETPLVLLAFVFAGSGRMRKQLLFVFWGFLTGEALVIAFMGLNLSSRAMVMGAGLLLILIYSVAGLWQYLVKMEHSRFENSMVFVYGALLFGYGSYLIIFVFAHLHKPEPPHNETDSFLLYYISLLLSAVITSAGLWSYKLRKRRPGSVLRGYSSSSS